jgi:histidyl-tRNA synthetase
VPAFGWALGLDRLATVLEKVHGKAAPAAPALLVPMGEAASLRALELARAWWAVGCAVQLETRGGGLKKALQTANRTGVKLALILGDGELERGVVAAKHLETGVQEEWPLDEVANRLQG